MLMDSIRLNYDITFPLHRKLKYLLYAIWFILAFFSCCNDREAIFLPAVVVTALGSGISMGLLLGILRKVFYQSLFEEEAYTYMLFPLSSEAVVRGKLIAVLYVVLDIGICYLILWLYMYVWWRDFSYGIGYWDVVIPECLTKDILAVGQGLFQRNFAAETVAFLIGSALIQFILVVVLFCSGAQLCDILDHLHNPKRKKNYVGVLLGLLLFGVIAFCLYLPTKIFCIISEGFITILPLLITMGLEVVLIGCCMHWSVRLLQTRYALN